MDLCKGAFKDCEKNNKQKKGKKMFEKYNLMTPGPTRMAENVRAVRSMDTVNPDEDFFKYYQETCKLLADIMNTDNQVQILTGEGILGLEAVCASLTEKGDRVLVLDNGVFGKGFEEFVKLYGGEAIVYTSDYHKPFDVEEIRRFLEKDSNFKYATVVHCDTPSGVLNDIESICLLLKEYDILTVVDSVAGMFGEPVDIKKSKIDVLCGGSQKALSAATGLTMLWISDEALSVMNRRKSAIPSFYANILMFHKAHKGRFFPYSQPVIDIYSLRRAIENVIEDKEIFQRHQKIAYATRKAVVKAGLELYLEDGYASTVTAINVPKGLTDKEILSTLKNKYGIIMSGSFDVLTGKVFRIGHMGENARVEFVADALDGLTKTLKDLKFDVKCDMKEEFLRHC